MSRFHSAMNQIKYPLMAAAIPLTFLVGGVPVYAQHSDYHGYDDAGYFQDETADNDWFYDFYDSENRNTMYDERERARYFQGEDEHAFRNDTEYHDTGYYDSNFNRLYNENVRNYEDRLLREYEYNGYDADDDYDVLGENEESVHYGFFGYDDAGEAGFFDW
jgi:hypothetical protein